MIESESVTVSVSSTLDAETATFSPLVGVRISAMDITSTPMVRRPYAVHPWNEIMPNTGRKTLRMQLEGYFHATAGEALLQQHALSGMPCLMQLVEGEAVRFQVVMHVLRFSRTQQPTALDIVRVELHSVGAVTFL